MSMTGCLQDQPVSINEMLLYLTGNKRSIVHIAGVDLTCAKILI